MSTTPHKPADSTKPADGTTKPAPTYPRLAYIKDPGTPGYKAVELKDADAEKALGVPVFDTAVAAAEFNPPIEQPIPNIARTNNEEQFVPGRSQLGAPSFAGVIQTPVPVRSVGVRTGVDVKTLAYNAVLPDGVDPAVLADPNDPKTAVLTHNSETGVPLKPVPHGPTPTHSA